MRLTQAQLARKIGVSKRWIMKLEEGHANARLDLVLRTFDALSIGLELQFRAIALHRRPAPTASPFSQNLAPELFINNGITPEERRVTEGNKRAAIHSAEIRGAPARELAAEIRDAFNRQRATNPDLTPCAFAKASLTKGWGAKNGRRVSFSTIYRALTAA